LYWRRRILRHALIAALAGILGAIAGALSQYRSTIEALSFSTAYAGLALLAAALAVGPLNVIRNRPNPVSTDLRRDIGIWAGIYGIAHTIIGLNVHMHGHMSRYFIPWTRSLDTSSKAFILANWLGLVAAILLLVLVSISNDYALRTLGTRRWKLIQQSTYVVVIAAVAHGAGYQIIEGRKWLLSGIFALLALCALILQSAGVRRYRKQNR
jgi:sulfoxide reductase heme-binding subunit YedZ